VAEWRLCVGCGACAAVCPEGNIRLVDVEKEGIRPFVDAANCKACGTCVQACPGLYCAAVRLPTGTLHHLVDARKRWGNVVELWEGFAVDSEIRYKGSSGGLCTALSVCCLEQGVAGGVVHVGVDPEAPWKNRTFRSISREEVLSRTGSRYSPASPCDGLRQIEEAAEPSVFVGKPCDVAGLRRAQALRPVLAEKTALAIGFFCAGTPSTFGTLELFRKYNVDTQQIASFRYRGNGWPGMATVRFKGKARPAFQLTYSESWGFVNKYRPFRCYLCPDLTAEFADISVGDPWYREVGEDEPGRSLILIRTERGRRIFRQAMQAGYVTAQKVDVDIIYRSQKNLLAKRQALWGRLLAMKLLRIPTPELKGFYLFENWLDLPFKEKLKSVLGTVRRIDQRNYFRPVRY
jgi:coenzyme F420 hydrogenase subunit beta